MLICMVRFLPTTIWVSFTEKNQGRINMFLFSCGSEIVVGSRCEYTMPLRKHSFSIDKLQDNELIFHIKRPDYIYY